MEDLIKRLRNNPNIETIYGLRFDSSFKNVYEDKEQLKRMIQELFHEEIPEIECFRNKELVKDNINLKCGICDLIAETKDSIILVEIQNKNLMDFNKRLKRYVSMLYATQKLGEDYQKMKPVKVYLMINYNERKKKKQVLKKYSEMEKELKEQFDCLSEISVWNIKEAIKTKNELDYNNARLCLLDKISKEEALNILEELYQKEEYKEKVEKIIIYNLDIETYQRLKEEKYMLETSFELETSGLRAEVKRKALREGREEGRKIGLKEGREKGLVEGRREGKIEMAISMLKEGLEMPLVQKITGLKEQQIIEYKKQTCI